MWLDFRALGTTKLAAAKKRLGPAQNLLLDSHRCLVQAANWWTTEISVFVRKADLAVRTARCFLDLPEGRPGAATG